MKELEKPRQGPRAITDNFLPKSNQVPEGNKPSIKHKENATAQGHAPAGAKMKDDATAPSPKAMALVSSPSGVNFKGEFAGPFMLRFSLDATCASQSGAVPNVKDPKNPVDWGPTCAENSTLAQERFANHDTKSAKRTVNGPPARARTAATT